MQDNLRKFIPTELQGLAGNNPYRGTISAARMHMYYSHIGQSLVVKGVTPRLFFTGVEDEYGKNTHSVRMPVNAEIFRIVDKDPSYTEMEKKLPNPLTMIVYQNTDVRGREFDILEVPKTHCLHQHYGFSYKFNPSVMQDMRPGNFIKAGTILADSPTVREDGVHMYATETNYCLITMPEVTEDGVLASEEWLDTQEVECFGERTFRFGGNEIPLNLHGTVDDYKILLDIGDTIPETGLLFATRKVDPVLAPIYMHPEALRKVESGDSPIYAIKGAVITDIEIVRGRNESPSYPAEFNAQCHFYLKRAHRFYKSLVDIEKELTQRYGNNYSLGPQLAAELDHAHAYCDQFNKKCEVEPYRDKLPVREWWVRVAFKYKMRPTIGNKISDEQGAKAVIVAKRPRALMPRDAAGNIADLVMDPSSIVGRNNSGAVVGMYINAATVKLRKDIRAMLNADSSREGYQAAWEYLYGYVSLLSPRQIELFHDPRFDIREELDRIEDWRPWLPPDNPVNYFDIIEIMMTTPYAAPYGPVTYVGNSGRTVVTKKPALVGSKATFLLEKDGRSWSAVASSRLHGSLGVPAKPGPSDKWSLPGKESPLKPWGETEIRLLYSAGGNKAIAYVSEKNNNPMAHKEECRSILTSRTPTNIEQVVDYANNRRTGGRIIELIMVIMFCMGIWLTKVKDEDGQ